MKMMKRFSEKDAIIMGDLNYGDINWEESLLTWFRTVFQRSMLTAQPETVIEFWT
jgi:hypothetical protein